MCRLWSLCRLIQFIFSLGSFGKNLPLTGKFMIISNLSQKYWIPTIPIDKIIILAETQILLLHRSKNSKYLLTYFLCGTICVGTTQKYLFHNWPTGGVCLHFILFSHLQIDIYIYLLSVSLLTKLFVFNLKVKSIYFVNVLHILQILDSLVS